eukprot:GILJ01019760.1.p1 GENE.GILJ01019760.1~~GILJ01019760.1.p1  ORF type:complete len:370 (+),score=60.31 GILJ01019760.1:89-1198(+)
MPPRPRTFDPSVAALIPKLLESLCVALGTVGPAVAQDRGFLKRCASVGVVGRMEKNAGFQITGPSEASCKDVEWLPTLQREAIRGTFVAMPDDLIAQLPPTVVTDYEDLLKAEQAHANIVDPLTLVSREGERAREDGGEAPASSTAAAASAEPSKESEDPNPKDLIRQRLVVWQGDMSILSADAVVNPANNALLGCFLPSHRCLDNILHAQSGPRLRLACREMLDKLGVDNDANGQCRVTEAFCLPAKFVFHTAGPDLNMGRGRVRLPTPTDQAELRSSYRKCLTTAIEMGLKSIAFCCISTGIFAYPAEEAAQLAIEEVTAVLSEALSEKKLAAADIPVVVFNVFKDEDLDIYSKLLPKNEVPSGNLS